MVTRKKTCTDDFYAPSPEDGVAGVEASNTFAEAETFAAFLLDLASSSFTSLVDMPELADFADWPTARLRFVPSTRIPAPPCRMRARKHIRTRECQRCIQGAACTCRMMIMIITLRSNNDISVMGVTMT